MPAVCQLNRWLKITGLPESIRNSSGFAYKLIFYAWSMRFLHSSCAAYACFISCTALLIVNHFFSIFTTQLVHFNPILLPCTASYNVG